MYHLLNRRLDVHRKLSVPDGMGGYAVERTKVAAVKARIPRPVAREQVEAGQAGATHTLTLYLERRAEVARGDELRDATSGEAWRVLSVNTPSRLPADQLRAEVESFEPEEVD